MKRTYTTCVLAALLNLATGCTINLGDVLELPPDPSDPEVDAGTEFWNPLAGQGEMGEWGTNGGGGGGGEQAWR